MTLRDDTISLLLFDIGGVLIDFDFDRAFRAWEPISRMSVDEMRQAFRHDLAYEQHERGEIGAAAYFAHVRDNLQLQDDPARIADGWNAIFLGEISETVAMVRAARATLPCYAFTNTNATHLAAWASMYPGIPTLFERVFASCELGIRKPETRVFSHVARTLGVTTDAILFFDDVPEYVEAASLAGVRAVQVRSPLDVRQALLEIGCPLPSA